MKIWPVFSLKLPQFRQGAFNPRIVGNGAESGNKNKSPLAASEWRLRSVKNAPSHRLGALHIYLFALNFFPFK
jgi:hypothetical protein